MCILRKIPLCVFSQVLYKHKQIYQLRPHKIRKQNIMWNRKIIRRINLTYLWNAYNRRCPYKWIVLLFTVVLVFQQTVLEWRKITWTVENGKTLVFDT